MNAHSRASGLCLIVVLLMLAFGGCAGPEQSDTTPVAKQGDGRTGGETTPRGNPEEPDHSGKVEEMQFAPFTLFNYHIDTSADLEQAITVSAANSNFIKLPSGEPLFLNRKALRDGDSEDGTCIVREGGGTLRISGRYKDDNHWVDSGYSDHRTTTSGAGPSIVRDVVVFEDFKNEPDASKWDDLKMEVTYFTGSMMSSVELTVGREASSPLKK